MCRLGGGGGGGGNYNPNEAVGGGGGGAYASRNLVVVPLTTYTVTVGGGGGVGVAGGASWFNMNSLVDVNSIVAAGGGTNTTNRNGGAGGTVANSNGTTRYAGGTGGDGSNNGGGGGGGGSALITANGGNGVDGGGTNGGTGGTGTGNGGNGGDEDGTPNAAAGNFPGGGGGGRGDDAGSSASGAPGQVIVNYALPANYLALFTNMDYGSSNWCQGETRQVTVSVTNTGALPWPDAAPDINIGVKWNAEADYFVRVNAGGLAAGASQTFSLTITAPNIAGANNLSFDVVKEGDCWFGNNNGSCGPGNSVYVSPAITIGADAVPTINAGTDIFTCSSTGAVNITAGSSSSIANINWSSPDGTGIFVDDGSLTTATFTPDAADIAAGWRTIELLAENASCTVTDTKIITITPAPTIDDLVASSVCSNQSTPIVFSAAAVADNYSALNWTTNGAHPSGVVNPSSLTTAEYTLDPADIGSVSFTLTATGNTGCGNEMKTKVINIIPEPVPVAGLDMTVCSNVSPIPIGADASQSNAASVQWLSSGTGTFTNPNDLTGATYTPTPADILAGSVTLTLRATGNSPCGNVDDTKTLSFEPAATSVAGADMQACASAANIDITTGSSASNFASVEWTSSGTGTWVSPTSLTLARYTPSLADLSQGWADITLTAFGNSPCGNQTDTKRLTLLPTPTVNSIAAITAICRGGTTAALNPTVSGTFGTITWSDAGLGGSFNPNANTLNATYTPPINYTGQVDLMLTLNATSCGSASGNISFDVIVPPNAGADAAVCQNWGSAINNIALTGTTGTGTVAWTVPTVGADGGFTSTTNLNTTWTPAHGFTGAATIRLTATSGACTGQFDDRTINVTPAIRAIIDLPYPIPCAGDLVNLSATLSGGATSIAWTAGVAGGSFIPNASTLSVQYQLNPTQSGNYHIYAMPGGVSNPPTVCTGTPIGDTINLLPQTRPIVEAGTNITACVNTTGVNITAGSSITGGTTSGQIWVTLGDGNFTNASSLTLATYNPGPLDRAAGTVTLRLDGTGTGNCNRVFSDTKTLTLDPMPVAEAGNDVTICSNTGAINITSGASSTNASSILWTGGNSGTWNNASQILGATYASSAFDAANSPVILTLTATGTLSCSAATHADTKQLIINPAPDATLSYAFAEYWQCSNDAAPTVGTAGGTYGATPAGLSINAGTGIIDVSASTPGTYTITYTIAAAGPCAMASDDFVVTIRPTPSVSSASANRSLCVNSPMTDIVFNVVSEVGAVTVSGLPAGVTGSFNAGTGVFTISGTPTATGTFNYTVTVNQKSGNAAQYCNGGVAYTAGGTIIVYTPPTISHNSGSLDLLACQGVGISPVGFNLGGDFGTPTVNVGGFPTGVTGNLIGNTYTLSGTPTQTGTFNYIITVPGIGAHCTAVTINGTIRVNNAPPTLAGPINGVTGICPPANNEPFDIAIDASVQTYEWVMPHASWTIVNGAGTNSIEVNVSGASPTGVLNLQVRGINGCGQTAFIPHAITIATFAGVDVSAAATTICHNDPVNLTGVLGGSASSLTWSINGAGNGTYDNNGILTPVYTPGATDRANGTVTLRATTDLPGGTCAGVGIDDIIITIRPQLAASISVTGANPICEGGNTTLTITGNPNSSVIYSISGVNQPAVDLGPTGIATVNTGVLLASRTYVLEQAFFNLAPACTTNISGSATVTVNPLVLVNAGADIEICRTAPNTVSLSGATVSGGTANGTWSFSPAGAGTGSLSNVGSTNNPAGVDFIRNPAFTGQVTLTLTSDDPAGPCGVVLDSRILEIDAETVVNAGPDLSICMPNTSTQIALTDASLSGPAGALAQWSIVSGGGTLTNSSFTATPNAVGYTPVNGPGNVSIVLQLTNNSPLAGNVCPVSNDTKNIEIYREVVVNPGPSQTICSGPSVTLTMAGTISGGASTGTWSTAGTGGFDNAGLLNAVYTPSAADKAAGQVILTLTSADPAGSCPAVPQSVTMYFSQPATVNAGTDFIACSGATVTLAGSGTGASTYVWSSPRPVDAFGNVNALNSSFTANTALLYPAADQLYNLTLTAIDPDGAGPCTDVTDVVQVTLRGNATISVPQPPQPLAVCSGAPFTVTPTYASSSLPQWRRFAAAGIAEPATGFVAANSFTNTLTNTTNGPISVNYTYQVSLAGGCNATTDFSITVNPTPQIPPPSYTASICGTNGSFVITPSHGSPTPATLIPAGTVYSWLPPAMTGGMTGGVAGSLEANVFGGNFNNPTDAAQTATYTVTPRAGTCNGPDFTVVATVNISPTAPDVSQTICSGQSFSATPVNAPPTTIAPVGVTYSWPAPDILPLGAVTGSSAANSVTTIGQQLTNITNANATVTYTVTPRFGTCNGTPFTVTITVNPSPVFSLTPAANFAVCSDVNGISITPNSVPAGTTFTWSRTPHADLTGLLNGSGPIVNGTIVNSSNATRSTTFTFVPNAGGCTGSGNLSVIVNVKPQPTVSASPATQALCSGENISQITLTNPNGVTGVSYSWSRDNTAANQVGTLATNGTGNTINGTATTTATTPQSSTITITATADGCLSPNLVLTNAITVNPLPATPTGTITIGTNNQCENVGVILTSTATPPANVVWYWQTTANGMDETNSGASFTTTAVGNNYAVWLRAKNTLTGCWSASSLASSATIIVRANPLPTLSAAYCEVAGKVRLRATASTAINTYAWTPFVPPGPTNAMIYDVDIANRYYATLTYTNGCSRQNFIDVADNLVVNGDFEAAVDYKAPGTRTFVTEYIYRTRPAAAANGCNAANNIACATYGDDPAPAPQCLDCLRGLWNETVYAVDRDPAEYHSNFGSFYDHTFGTIAGKFLMINGSTSLNAGGQLRTIWQQTVPVEAGKAYYFSGWGTNMHGSNAAQLQFEVDGILVGTIADLTGVAVGTWVRFYSDPTWTAPFTGNVNIRIRNLNPVAGGNDFGLDDIVFGTLAPTPASISGILATSPVCPGETITLTPTIVNGRTPFTYVWAGPSGFTSNQLSPTIPGATTSNAGTYTLQVIDGYGCNPPATRNSNAVTVLNGTPGIWTGAVDTDWYWCRNWASGTLPTNVVDVSIPVGATNNSVIDPATSPYDGGQTAKSRNISIDKGLSFGNTGILEADGTLTITNTNGSVNMTPGGEIRLKGNWINNYGLPGFTAGVGRLSMVGATAQSINTVGIHEIFYNLLINNSSGLNNGITLLKAARVENILTLTNGVVKTYSVPPVGAPNTLGLLTVGTAGTAIATSPVFTTSNSFVTGRLAKEFNSAPAVPVPNDPAEFIFPVGKVLAGPVSRYRPPGVLPTTANGTTTFTAEYFNYEHPVLSWMGNNVMGIIRPEHWQIDRSGSNAEARVKIPYLYWSDWMHDGNAYVDGPTGSRRVAVVKKESDIWNFTSVDYNNNWTWPESNPYATNGAIYSAPVTTFSPFSIGFSFEVILPVNLLSFEGVLQNGNGVLSWKISNPEELGSFDVQYSQNGRDYQRLSTIAGTGSTNYQFTHPSLGVGLHYYRLLMKDKLGQQSFSKVVLLRVNSAPTHIVGLVRNPVREIVSPIIYSNGIQQVRAVVTDVLGRQIMEKKITLANGLNQWNINSRMLMQGMYFIHLITDDKVSGTLKFMKE